LTIQILRCRWYRTSVFSLTITTILVRVVFRVTAQIQRLKYSVFRTKHFLLRFTVPWRFLPAVCVDQYKQRRDISELVTLFFFHMLSNEQRTYCFYENCFSVINRKVSENVSIFIKMMSKYRKVVLDSLEIETCLEISLSFRITTEKKLRSISKTFDNLFCFFFRTQLL